MRFMPIHEITNEEFNKLPDTELNRYILGMNDGQGDHAMYTFEGMMELLDTDSDPINFTKITNIEVLTMFYDLCQLNGNSTHIVYFNEVYHRVQGLDF